MSFPEVAWNDRNRCRHALKYQTARDGVLYTRCAHVPHDTANHGGRGLEDREYTVERWETGDAREFLTDRPDAYAWREGKST